MGKAPGRVGGEGRVDKVGIVVARVAACYGSIACGCTLLTTSSFF